MEDVVTEQGTKLSEIEAAVPVAVDAALEAGASPEDIQAASDGKAGVEILPPSNVATMEESIAFNEEYSATLEDNVYNSQDEYENPYEVKVVSDDNQRKIAATNAAILGYSRGENIEEVYNDALGRSPEETKDMIRSMALGELDEEFSGALQLLTEGSPEYITDDARELQESYKTEVESLEPTKNVLAHYRGYARSMNGGENFTEEQVDDIAFNKYLQDKIGAIFDEDYGILDGVADFAGMMFVPNISYDSAELAKSIGGDAYASTYLNSSDFLFKLRDVLGDPEIPVMQRMKFFDTLADNMEDIDDNKMKQMQLLMGISGIDSEGTVEFDLASDKFDQATIGVGLGARVIKAVRSANNLIQLSTGADVKTMGVVMDIAARSDEGAAAMGVPRLHALASVDPRTDVLHDMIEGAPLGVASKLSGELTTIDKLTDEAMNLAEEGIELSDAEKAAAVTRATSKYEKIPSIENVVGKITDDGIEVTYDLYRPRTDDDFVGPRVGEDETYGVGDIAQPFKVKEPYIVDDITGGFKQDKVSFVSQAFNRVLSPNFVQGKDKASLVQAFERIMFQGSKIKGDYNKAINLVSKDLSKKEAESVSNILLKGDDESKVFTYKELVQDGVGGSFLTDKEYTAYAGIRRVMDNAWVVKNAETRKKLVLKGIKELNVDGKKLLAKPINKFGAAKQAYLESPHKSLLVPSPPAGGATKLNSITPDELKDYYDKGYQLVRGDTMGTWFKNGDTNSTFALIKADQVRELPPVVMNRQQGYIPRTYKDSHFFVKQDRIINVDGVEKTMGQRTLRYFDNVTDAKKHIRNLARDARAKGEDFNDSHYSVLADREMKESDLETDGVDMFGGLYTSSRGDKPLKFGVEGLEGQRKDAIESVQNYVNHIGNRYPMAEYRIGIEKTWMNHAKNSKMLPVNYDGSFSEAFAIVKHGAGDTMVKTKLLNSHRHISFMTKTPTLGEQNLQGLVRSIGKSLEAGKFKGMAKYVYRLDHNDPIDALRGATFNLMLGMYNWSQVLVQGFGASIAMTVHPVHGIKAIPKMLAFGYLDNIKNPDALQGAIEFLAKNKGLDVHDIAEDYRLWKKTGLYESVVNTNADVSAIMNGMPYDAGVLRKLWANGTMPFKMGELANMRISFNTALSKWKSLNKGKAVDDAALKGIVARAEQLRLQMSSGNKADYQKGIMSLPTQFLQINAKFIEAVAGDNFTIGEKLRLFAGQGALFGAAGVPLGDMIYKSYVEMSGRDVTQMTEEEQIVESRGIIGWVFNHQLGLNSAVVSRTAIGSGVIDQLIKYATEPMESYKILLGPTASTVDRATDVVETALNVGKIIYRSEELSKADYGMLVKVLAKSVAEMPSSTRNIMLAYHLRESGIFKTSAGKFVYQDDQDVATIIMQGLGFSNQDYADYWSMVMDEKSRARTKDATVGAITNLYLDLFNAADHGSEEEQRAYDMGISALLQGYPDQADKTEILNAVRNRIESKRDAKGVLIKKVLETSSSKLSSYGSEINPLIVRELEEANNAE